MFNFSLFKVLDKSVTPMDMHAQHTLNYVREQLLKELYEFYEDDDKWRIGEILLLLCSIMVFFY
jgi:hypothetical protein